MTTVYIVRGDSGQYSSFEMWDVKGYRSEEEAKALCARLNDWLKVRRIHRSDCKVPPKDRVSLLIEGERPPEDAGFTEPSYSGNEYTIWEVDLVDL